MHSCLDWVQIRKHVAVASIFFDVSEALLKHGQNAVNMPVLKLVNRQLDKVILNLCMVWAFLICLNQRLYDLI